MVFDNILKAWFRNLLDKKKQASSPLAVSLCKISMKKDSFCQDMSQIFFNSEVGDPNR